MNGRSGSWAAQAATRAGVLSGARAMSVPPTPAVCRRSEGDRQRRRSPGQRRPGPAGGVDVDVERRGAPEELADHDAGFEAGQGGAEAVVDAVAEGDVALDVAAY